MNPPLMLTLKCALLFDPAVIEMELDDRAAWQLETIMASLQWLTRTIASIEPKPVAWSNPVAALNPLCPGTLLLPLVTS